MPTLNLRRPIVFFDLETTGTDAEKDRICSMSFLKYFPGQPTEDKFALVNPQCPIPKGATEVHGITDEMVTGKPIFKQYSAGVMDFIRDCDLAAFNGLRFDLPMLFCEFERAKVVWDLSDVHFIDPGNIYKIQEPRTLSAAFKFYTGKELEGAHDATVDNRAMLEVFIAQLDKYEDLPESVEDLALFSNFGKQRLDVTGKFTFDQDNDIVFNFGKNKDKKAQLSEFSGYLKWMLGGDFASDAKKICNDLLTKKNETKNGKLF